MVKYLDDVSSWELLFIRCLIQMFAMCPLMACFHQNPLGPPDLPTRYKSTEIHYTELHCTEILKTSYLLLI